VFLIDAAHEGGGGWKDFVDKYEDGLLGSEFDALSDDVAELADGQVGGDKILLLVYRGDVGLFHLFTDDGDSVGVLLPDALGLGLAFLKCVFILKLGSHLGS